MAAIFLPAKKEISRDEDEICEIKPCKVDSKSWGFTTKKITSQESNDPRFNPYLFSISEARSARFSTKEIFDAAMPNRIKEAITASPIVPAPITPTLETFIMKGYSYQIL
jgi:hypothetical protein